MFVEIMMCVAMLFFLKIVKGGKRIEKDSLVFTNTAYSCHVGGLYSK